MLLLSWAWVKHTIGLNSPIFARFLLCWVSTRSGLVWSWGVLPHFPTLLRLMVVSPDLLNRPKDSDKGTLCLSTYSWFAHKDSLQWWTIRLAWIFFKESKLLEATLPLPTFSSLMTASSSSKLIRIIVTLSESAFMSTRWFQGNRSTSINQLYLSVPRLLI